jgi:glycosyltransferase involved in cell wall biosynthesis
MTDPVEVSVVIPVYACEACLRELHRRLTRSLDWTAGSYELVFVEDRGPDNSWEVLNELAERDEHVRAFRLSRNFGQHAAITAGLSKSRGRWTVVMDCDLQDPPEEIRRLQAKAAEGYDIVLARRTRKRASIARRLTGRLYAWLLNIFAGASIDPGHGSFSIISRKVVDSFLTLGDRDRHYLLVLYWLGYERTSIEYDHAPRAAGKSSYTFRRLVGHAIGGMFFQTTVLLRWVVYSGFFLALLGVGAAIYFAVNRLAGHAYPGWTSLAVLLLLIGGLIILSTGVTGLYIGRVFHEVRRRPLYVIDETVESTESGGSLQPNPARERRQRTELAARSSAHGRPADTDLR